MVILQIAVFLMAIEMEIESESGGHNREFTQFN